MVLISEKVKDQIEAIIEQLGEDQDKSSIKSKKSSSSSNSEHGTENDEADTGNGLRHSIYIRTVHRGAFCQFSFRWIHYYGSNKSTGLETGKSHICAVSS